MHVLGLSLTATSAVWVLLDTSSGTILADEVVPEGPAEEVARTAAQSVQAFAAHAAHPIDRVHLTWTADGQPQGVRLRTKLRLYGFDAIDTLTQDEAREGRNRTARHIAPHLAMAYGAARAGHADEPGSPLQKLTALVPHPVADPGGIGARWSRFVDDARTALDGAAARRPVQVAGGVAAVAVVGLVAYALVGTSPPAVPAPEPVETVAESVQSPPEAAHIPAPQPVVARPDTETVTPADVTTIPESVIVAESVVAESVPVVESAPVVESVPVVETSPAPTWSAPQTVPVVEAAVPDAGVGEAHLSGPAPVLGPIAVPDPVSHTGPVAPPAPEPPSGPLSPFLGALP